MQVSISYFDQILEKRESQTRQVWYLWYLILRVFNFVVFKLFAGTKFHGNGRKSRNLIPLKQLVH